MQDDNLQMRQQTTPICPVPQGTPQEEAESYSLGIAGTYVSQHVADIPVWIEGVCFIGSIESYFGRGENLDIASPKEHEIIGSYEVTGLRNTVSVKSGWKPREGENGVW